jgi:hypothetical protein
MLVAPTRHIVAALIPRLYLELCIHSATRDEFIKQGRRFGSPREAPEFSPICS